MNAKHTPGPWLRNIKPASKYSVIFAGQNTHVAQVVSRGLSEAEIEANADLIAAAPELLEALRAAFDTDLTYISGQALVPRQAVLRARAVIQQAVGGLDMQKDLVDEQGYGKAELTKAAADVLAERSRQVDAEGWTPEHDDQHKNGDLAKAGAAYAAYGASFTVPNGLWPWSIEWWKPTGSKRRALVKAGALILAEIERLDRLTPNA